MIVLVVEIETTEETIASLTEAIVTMQEASRAEEGCHDYTFCVALGDASKLRVNECWEDEAALKRHFATPHMAAFNKAVGAAGPLKTRIACYDATEVPFPMQRG